MIDTFFKENVRFGRYMYYIRSYVVVFTDVEHPGIVDDRGNELPGRLVEIAGVDTFVYDYGSGSPILFIHGYGDTADGWRMTIPEVITSHRIIAFDLPPFGRSEDPKRTNPTPLLVDFYKEFFLELYEKLGLKKATVVGHSLGGTVALELALDRPELVDRLVVVAPAGLGKHPPLWWYFLAYLSKPMSALPITPVDFAPRLVRQSVKSFAERLVVHNRSENGDKIRHLVNMHGTRKNLGKLLSAGSSMIGEYDGSLRERCAELKPPTLGIWGRNDALVPVRHSNLFAEASPVVRNKVIDNCGHYPQVEHPETFARTLKQFMRKSRTKKRTGQRARGRSGAHKRRSAA